MNRARKHQPAARLKLTESPRFQEKRIREAIIETRLHALSMFVERFGPAAYSALVPEPPSTRKAIEELCVKESGLRWILRVAKHSEGLVRERLWMDIEKALTDLEGLAESIRNSEHVIPFSGSSALRCDSAETPQPWGNAT